MPFGQYRGEDLEDVPEDYLVWCLDELELSPTLRFAVERQLGLIDDGYGGSAAEALPGIVFRWADAMRTHYHRDPAALEVIELGLAVLQHLCVQVTRRPWPAEVRT